MSIKIVSPLFDCKCNSCGSDHDIKLIRFENGNQGIEVVICKDCMRDLKAAVDDEVIQNDQVFHVYHIDWDTDDEEVDLPESVDIRYEELAYPGELEQGIDPEILKERIEDYLSDMYGFCMYGMMIG